jgi:DnaJ-class molecular chaperone
MKSLEDIEQIAIEMNRERGNCPTCGRTGRRGEDQCDQCLGRGYLWFDILLDPSIKKHALSSGITSEQMKKQWEKRQKRRVPVTVEK